MLPLFVLSFNPQRRRIRDIKADDKTSSIEWVDFIKFVGTEYQRIDTGILAEKHDVGEKLGTVKFKVANNVKKPNYKSRNGDAAFHEKGTEIFQITDQPHLIAVKDTRAINGYQLYFSRDDMDYQWHFKDMPIEKVKIIEIYQTEPQEGNKLMAKLTKSEDVHHFLQLLVEGEDDPNFEPNMENGDPIFYEKIFYTEAQSLTNTICSSMGKPITGTYGIPLFYLMK